MKCSENEVEIFKKKAGTLGVVPGLDNMRHLMAEFGNIQDKLSVIHVAGTNGKGSVSAMLERVLRLGGYRTGLYSSPAVFFEEEKFRVNGEAIAKEELNGLFSEIAAACERLIRRGLNHPTLFEIETAAAFLWFYRQKCEIVILEVGFGGAMDATNIIKKPLCSVITSVSMDHMAILGDTLTKIAGEKAGIIKEGCPVVTARQQPEVYEVLKQVCRERHAALFGADTEVLFTEDTEEGALAETDSGGFSSPDGTHMRRRKAASARYRDGYLCFDWEGYSCLQLSLLGAYQVENGMCVVRTLEVLAGLGFPVGESTLREGLRTTIWPGRFEVISRKPLFVMDGAHNADAAKKLRQTLELGFTNYRIIYIIGVLRDKEHEKILKCLLPLAEMVYTVTPDSPRALSGEELCREAGKFHGDVSFAGSVRNALELALAKAKEWEGSVEAAGTPDENRDREPEVKQDGRPGGQPPMILAFGSLSYLGELKREFEKLNYRSI